MGGESLGTGSRLGCYIITEIFGLDNQAYYTFSQKTTLSCPDNRLPSQLRYISTINDLSSATNILLAVAYKTPVRSDCLLD